MLQVVVSLLGFVNNKTETGNACYVWRKQEVYKDLQWDIHRHRYNDNIKMNILEIGYQIKFGQGGV